MAERRVAIINVSKGLLEVSLTTLSAVAGAVGNAPLAGAAALAQSALAAGALKPLLERKQEEHLALPLPRWWTGEPQLKTWQDTCSHIEQRLPAILKGTEERLRQETNYPSSETVKRLFIEQVAQQLSPWEISQQDRSMVATYVAPLLLEKTSAVLKATIDTTRQDALAQWLAYIAHKLDMIQQAATPTALPALPASPAQASTLALEDKVQRQAYDVYICYDEGDEAEVMKIGEQLKNRGILPWFDGVAQPGTPRKLQQEEQIKQVSAAAVFIGQQAIKRGQLLQIYACIDQYIDRECAVIPVLLANALQKPELPPFLAEFGWVDFRKPIPDPLKQLVWGIAGVPPV